MTQATQKIQNNPFRKEGFSFYSTDVSVLINEKKYKILLQLNTQV